MDQIGVDEAMTTLSQLLRVAAGEEIVITTGGRPAARLAGDARLSLDQV